MIKVITYGTYDHLHLGHINLLKRAKALGDYLIVGVTTENFDINRGKINVEQSLTERMEAVKTLGIADEVIPEEYEGQKIDDIIKYNIDIFTVGSDWDGYFDYLNEYCKVIYLPRTKGISSTKLRNDTILKMGIVGTDITIKKFINCANNVDGIEFNSIYFDEEPFYDFKEIKNIENSYDDLLKNNDIIYVASRPKLRYELIKKALNSQKHVISESPIALKKEQVEELYNLASKNNVKLFDSIKTAFLLSFQRMILLIKSGAIGEIKSIDLACTSLSYTTWIDKTNFYDSLTSWGTTGLLPVFKILGYDYKSCSKVSYDVGNIKNAFTKINLMYDNCCATISLGIGVKSESDLRISGTKGYIYVKSPWWKSEYFEVRTEHMEENRPYFFQSDGEGIQMELVHLINCIKNDHSNFYVNKKMSEEMIKIYEEK